MAENPGNRIPEISKDLAVHGKTLERWIRAAHKKNLIEFRGSKKTGGYYLVKRADNKDANGR